MNYLPIAEFRNKAVREAIVEMMVSKCTLAQRDKFNVMHNDKPWKYWTYCPDSMLGLYYEIVCTWVNENESKKLKLC